MEVNRNIIESLQALDEWNPPHLDHIKVTSCDDGCCGRVDVVGRSDATKISRADFALCLLKTVSVMVKTGNLNDPLWGGPVKNDIANLTPAKGLH